MSVEELSLDFESFLLFGKLGAKIRVDSPRAGSFVVYVKVLVERWGLDSDDVALSNTSSWFLKVRGEKALESVTERLVDTSIVRLRAIWDLRTGGDEQLERGELAILSLEGIELFLLTQRPQVGWKVQLSTGKIV